MLALATVPEVGGAALRCSPKKVLKKPQHFVGRCVPYFG